MRSVSKAENGICLSIQAIARELKCCRKRLSEHVKYAELKPAGTGPTGYPTYRLGDIVSMMIAEALEKAAVVGNPRRWTPRDRLNHYRAENERVKLETSQGQLIPADDVANAMATVFKSLTLALETLPDQVEIEAGLSRRQADVMRRMIDGQRQHLHNSLVGTFAR
jgi:hypothetical protein